MVLRYKQPSVWIELVFQIQNEYTNLKQKYRYGGNVPTNLQISIL